MMGMVKENHVCAGLVGGPCKYSLESWNLTEIGKKKSLVFWGGNSLPYSLSSFIFNLLMLEDL